MSHTGSNRCLNVTAPYVGLNVVNDLLVAADAGASLGLDFAVDVTLCLAKPVFQLDVIGACHESCQQLLRERECTV